MLKGRFFRVLDLKVVWNQGRESFIVWLDPVSSALSASTSEDGKPNHRPASGRFHAWLATAKAGLKPRRSSAWALGFTLANRTSRRPAARFPGADTEEIMALERCSRSWRTTATRLAHSS